MEKQTCWICGAEYYLIDHYSVTCSDQCALEWNVWSAIDADAPIHGPGFRFKNHPDKDALNRKIEHEIQRTHNKD